MPYATSGFYNRDPAEARVYSVRADGDMPISLNFLLREYAQRGEDRVVLHPALSVALQRIRTRWRVPVAVLSAYRTPDHNAAVGGDPNSYHLLGMAADIRISSSGDTAGIASYARDVLGMSVGLHPSGDMHVSVGAEGGADRTIVQEGVYVQFPNLFPDGVDRQGGIAEVVTDGPFLPTGTARIAAAGGGLIGGLALALVGVAVLRESNRFPF